MKTFILTAILALSTATIIVSCERTSPITNENTPMKVNIRLVAIDSVSEARTEDKALFINIK